MWNIAELPVDGLTGVLVVVSSHGVAFQSNADTLIGPTENNIRKICRENTYVLMEKLGILTISLPLYDFETVGGNDFFKYEYCEGFSIKVQV